jgi:hypothetical protein
MNVESVCGLELEMEKWYLYEMLAASSVFLQTARAFIQFPPSSFNSKKVEGRASQLLPLYKTLLDL